MGSLLSQKPTDQIPRVESRTGSHGHSTDTRRYIECTVDADLKESSASRSENGTKQTYKEKFVKNVGPLRERFSDELVGVSVPLFESVKSAMHRSRAKLRPVLPQALSDISLEYQRRKTLGEEFLPIYDGTTSRILGFSTIELLNALSDADVIFMDGTFKIAPQMFTQLYTLHGSYRGHMIPCAFFLLPDKTEEAYERMLNPLGTCCSTKGISFSPTAFQIDFEVAVPRAIQVCHSSAELEGCSSISRSVCGVNGSQSGSRQRN